MIGCFDDDELVVTADYSSQSFPCYKVEFTKKFHPTSIFNDTEDGKREAYYKAEVFRQKILDLKEIAEKSIELVRLVADEATKLNQKEWDMISQGYYTHDMADNILEIASKIANEKNDRIKQLEEELRISKQTATDEALYANQLEEENRRLRESLS